MTKTVENAVHLLQRGQPAKAAELCRKVLRRAPTQPDAWHLLSVALFQQGNAEAAVDHAGRAIEIDPRVADYHSNRGRYLLSIGRLDEALKGLQQAIELAPRHPAAHYNLASALVLQGDRKSARQWLEKYVELAPEDPGGHHLLATVLADMMEPAEAARRFERVLELAPQSAEARNNLGNVLQSMGRHADAVPHYEEALRLKPDYADARSNLGAALQAVGRIEEALRYYEEALRLQPGLVAVRGNIANLLASQRRHTEAVELYESILLEMPRSAETWNNLGNSLQELGNYDAAMQAYARALAVNPHYYLVYNNAGNTLRRQGRYAEALAQYEAGLARNPEFAEAINNIGVTLQDLGRGAEAIQQLERAVALRPDYADPLINMGNAWRDMARPGKAAECYRRAAALAPANPYIWNNLGCALGDEGLPADAIECYERTLTLMPDNHQAFSNILLNLHYLPGNAPDQIFQVHRRFQERFGDCAARFRRPHDRPAESTRKLRIGYVSADLRRHSVAFFLEPLIENHDRSEFDIFCYADVARPDAQTARFAALAGDNWRDIRGYNDERFADLVRRDRIDILVDLGGHTANSRLVSFTSTPAPVQVTYLGYPNTTGLDCIGYRITDAWADPPGRTERWHTEQLIRLEGGFLCFRPPTSSPAVSPLPSHTGAPFTFGSFNNMAKVSAETLDTWAEILQAVPASRLALKNKALAEPEARQRVLREFQARGIQPDRIWMAGLIESLAGHLDAYRLLDVALDTYPYHGTTTTCEAMWMGVPVITRVGATHVSRVGWSLHNAAGITGASAPDRCAYVRLAVEWANSPDLLEETRKELRERMRESPLMDEAAFAPKVEAAYREMWRRWCA